MGKLINSNSKIQEKFWRFFLLVICNAAVCVKSVRLTNVTVPIFGVLGSTAQLYCDFSLESDQLLVLKWYKEEQEFFRFSPTADPNIVIFNLSGVHVDIRRSDLNTVTLKNLSLESSGLYKCEVSADKTFQTLTKQGQMNIIALPLYEPEIFGVPPSTSIGDMIAGKCTSHRSKPAAELNLYVNNDLANAYVSEYITITEPDGLDASVLGFNFTVEPKHFRRNRIIFKCTATVGNSYLVRTQSVTKRGTKSAGFTGLGLNRFLAGHASRNLKDNNINLSLSLVIVLWFTILD